MLPATAPTELSFPEALDSTMLSLFGSCPQSFFIEYVLKRAPTGRSIHLHAGGCMARAFEVIQIEFFHNGRSYEDCLLIAFREFMLQWGMFDPREKSYKDFVNCWGAVEAYFKEYPLEEDHFRPLIAANGKPMVEFKFAVPMEVNHPETGNPLLYSGRADTMVTSPQNLILVRDEKTTASLGASWYYQWDMRGQFLGYTYCARAAGIPAAGALVRGIAIQQTQYGFAEKPLFYTDEQLSRWWDQINIRAERAVKMWYNSLSHLDDRRKLHNQWDLSYGDACAAYGGCVKKDCCISSEPWNIYNGWEKRVWDPLAHDPTRESEDRMTQMGSMTLAEFMGEGW